VFIAVHAAVQALKSDAVHLSHDDHLSAQSGDGYQQDDPAPFRYQVDKLTRQLDSEEEAREGYRVNILRDAEQIGLALEIMNKIENGLGDKSIPQMPTTLRRQLTETLGYVTDRQNELLAYRKEGDSKPRSYEEYRQGV
jgi:hypothetical protein